MDVIACADLVPERAETQAETFGVPRSCSPEELLAATDIDLVVNLTIPAVHAELTSAALQSGKSVYGEKPLALDRDEAGAVMALAAARGVRVGSAPDTFLGAGFQTCRSLIDEGAIGEPLAASAFVVSRGPEVWHPDPDFFYRRGAGPLFDMGPYYITTLVHLLGPVRRVTGLARISRSERVILSEPLRGTVIRPDVPTHVAAVLDMASGPIVTLIASFDVPASRLPRMEIYGTEGTLWAPDPNTFGGPVRVRRPADKDIADLQWDDVALRGTFAEQSRGIGVADMVLAASSGQPHRASGDLALHVVDVLQAIIEASESGRTVSIDSTIERPEPLPEGWDGTGV
jgi:predicted dehydrogenase